MADERDRLREALDQVQSQLDDVRQHDPNLAANLEATVREAKAALERVPLRTAEHSSLVKKLGETIERYEKSHPKLAAALGGIVDALAEIGI
jgi:septal ring factor EnvC (AmiA/AmiB activator)